MEIKKRQSMKQKQGMMCNTVFTKTRIIEGGDEADSVVYNKTLDRIDFTELRNVHQERELRRQQEFEEVSLKIKVESSLFLLLFITNNCNIIMRRSSIRTR